MTNTNTYLDTFNVGFEAQISTKDFARIVSHFFNFYFNGNTLNIEFNPGVKNTVHHGVVSDINLNSLDQKDIYIQLSNINTDHPFPDRSTVGPKVKLHWGATQFLFELNTISYTPEQIVFLCPSFIAIANGRIFPRFTLDDFNQKILVLNNPNNVDASIDLESEDDRLLKMHIIDYSQAGIGAIIKYDLKKHPKLNLKHCSIESGRLTPDGKQEDLQGTIVFSKESPSLTNSSEANVRIGVCFNNVQDLAEVKSKLRKAHYFQIQNVK